MGAIYHGRQAALDRGIAIKLLPAEMAADAEFVARFQREARTLARLQHSGIVQVYDFGQTSLGHLYFVMEYVDGTDLHQIIHGGGLDSARTLEIVSQVCDALQYAHSEGVVHRDIKPANILMAATGQAKLADFGLARPAGDGHSLSQSNVVMGTPDYLAPEALVGDADHRADLYSVGVMLYEMLTGEPPRGRWVLPSQRVPVDARLDQVVVKALEGELTQRYQQAGEIKADIEVIRTTPAPGSSAIAPKVVVRRKSKLIADTPKPTLTDPPKVLRQSGATAKSTGKPGVVIAAVGLPVILIGIGIWMWPAAKEEPVPGMAEVQPVSAVIPAEHPPALEKVSPGATPTPTPSPAGATPNSAQSDPGSDAPAPVVAEITSVDAQSFGAYPAGLKVLIPKWLRQAGAEGGKLEFLKSADIAKKYDSLFDLGKAAEFDDFVAVYKLPYGWLAARKNGEVFGKTWDAGFKKVVSIGPVRARSLQRGFHSTIVDTDGNVIDARNELRKQSGPEGLVRVTGHVALSSALQIFLGEGNRILQISNTQTGAIPPPDDFFAGAAVICSSGRSFFAGGPGIPLRSWDTKTGAPVPFKELPTDTVEIAASGSTILLLASDGRVSYKHATSGVGNPPGIAPPADANPTIRVRAAYLNLAQRSDGTWRGWRNKPEDQAGDALIRLIETSGPLLDVDTGAIRFPGGVVEGTYALTIKPRQDLLPDAPVVPASSLTRIESATGTTATEQVESGAGAPVAAPVTATASPDLPADLAKRFATIDEQFQTAYDRDIASVHEASLADIDTKYLAAVNRALDAVTRAGKLDAVVKIQAEIDRLAAGLPLPGSESADLPEALKKLRTTYREAVARLDADRLTKARPYFDRHDELLEAYQSELTRERRIDDALLVKARREKLRLEREVDQNAGDPADNDPTAGTVSSEMTSTAAAGEELPIPEGASIDSILEWVFKNGGRAVVVSSEGRATIESIAEAPNRKFDLTEIRVNGKLIGDREFAQLGAASDLVKLDLEDGGSAVSTLAPLRNLRELQSISMRANRGMSDTELVHLAGLDKLQRITLNLRGGGEGCGHLKSLRSLRELTLYGVVLSEEGARTIAELSSLTRLALNRSVLEGNQDTLAAIGQMSELTNLTLDTCVVTSAGFAHLNGLEKLKTLILNNSRIANDAFTALTPSARNLITLEMQFGATISDEGIRQIVATFPNLERISCSTGSTCTADSIVELAKLPKLKSISWWVTNTNDETYRLLADLPAIETITLSGTAITDAGLSEFPKCKSLWRLNLTNTAITDAGLEHLKNIKPLTELLLSKTKVTSAGVEAFRKARSEVKVDF